ncbi:bifunctional phosphoribosylaminoimidazolecarboxamide formyltransferase/IMP cyclohydrolase [Alphaproteobacteria bacterium]|nr:bifunctional phosphoribosylaminoimidazolecarboxamide formyltransferase/IMP cyclohydrolase [Alphaproteobacteria bacterium]
MKIKDQYALISVFNKINLNFVCKVFKKNNIKIISTGSTSKYIKKIGYNCISVSNLTKFKEILDGRVKTIHPKIHASLLYKRSDKNHVKSFNKLNFPSINFVIVNLYPFEKTIKLYKSNNDKAIEMIDIGGPALLRSAAKNYKYVTTVSNPSDYKNLINNMKKNGQTTMEFRRKMANKVFSTTANYDATISKWFENKNNTKSSKKNKEIKLRYGENPYQKASFISTSTSQNIIKNIIQGKKIGYNNFLDIDAALNCLNEFSENACVIIKHNNPCGVALGNSSLNAFKKALNCDQKSAFGGVVAFNRRIDEKLTRVLNKHFFEIVIGKNFTENSKKIFEKKEKLILINSQKILVNKGNEIRSINAGLLKQNKNLIKISKKIIKCVSLKKSNQKEKKDLIFALKVCKHVKSNAIVLAKNMQTVGIGAGQMSRVDSTKISLSKSDKKFKEKGFVAASDAFFPFNDSVKLLINNNCKSIIQPMGSINDKKVIDLVNKNKISLFFTNQRFFKH